ncbi:hypothetical protein ACN42_g8083 [Penicillium freii]|uniref:Uncharacterized protein n=1 Tax=Penicillium freii TaxID=48697 RepID=A0A117NMD2_PENFR|nr:hypothetical protein ACN42_g8083 [Penicillium freii]
MPWDQATIQLRCIFQDKNDDDIPSGRLSICRSPATRALRTRGTPDLRNPSTLKPHHFTNPLLGAIPTIPAAWDQQVSLPRCAHNPPISTCIPHTTVISRHSPCSTSTTKRNPN